METRPKLLRKVQTQICTECGGLMRLEIATTDAGSSPDTHTQYETKYWLCEICEHEEDYIPN